MMACSFSLSKLKPSFLAVALGLGFVSSLSANGLIGVPSAITGTEENKIGASNETMQREGRQVGQYVREQIERIPPGTVRPAQARSSTTDFSPVQPLSAPGQRPAPADVEPNASTTAVSTPAVVRPTQVRFVLPEGMTVVGKDQVGAAAINGDKPGTYVLKVPPLLFSRLVLPFAAEVTTPFPDQVVIKQQDRSLLVAPKSAMPVNLIVYHPLKPEISIGLVLVPDGGEIPATIHVEFDPERLPADVAASSVDGSSRQITSMGIATRINEPDQRAAMRFERSNDHTAILENVHRLVSQGLVPDGYSLEVVTEGVVGALCGDRRLLGQFTQRMRGDRFTVDVFSVANAHDDYVVFSEENCYRRGVASVQFFPSRNLAPGKTAELIIVHANELRDEPTQLRRPMQVRIDP